MDDFEVYGVDFLKGNGQLMFNKLTLRTDRHRFIGESIPISEIIHIESVSSHSSKDFGSSVGAGAIGGLMFGAAGVLGGVMLGKSKGKISFVARFRDGRTLVGTADHSIFNKLLAAALKNRHQASAIAPNDPTQIDYDDFDDRVLCSDGNCIGIIGPDGRCRSCGKYDGE